MRAVKDYVGSQHDVGPLIKTAFNGVGRLQRATINAIRVKKAVEVQVSAATAIRRLACECACVRVCVCVRARVCVCARMRTCRACMRADNHYYCWGSMFKVARASSAHTTWVCT